ncbi:MAG: hypothetical protein U1D98_00865, partial [Candidatus Gracilibacteria bacterium]|nr:hypothetical protein [Candidatus Gracilibacteria bacterium]
NGILRNFCGLRPRKTQFHGGFLADDMEVRRAKRGINHNGILFILPLWFIANFLHFAEGKTSKFPVKESDNFCPKAIRNLQPCWTGSIIVADTNSRLHGFF